MVSNLWRKLAFGVLGILVLTTPFIAFVGLDQNLFQKRGYGLIGRPGPPGLRRRRFHQVGIARTNDLAQGGTGDGAVIRLGVGDWHSDAPYRPSAHTYCYPSH